MNSQGNLGARETREGIYWKSLCEDYGAAVRDIVSDSRSRPRKAAVVVSGMATFEFCLQWQAAWLRFHQRVLDVGLLGNWVVLALKMRDFDVNSAEWEETARS
ncbi:hypothetical protein IscW_ISCW012898 [Ixodes scapularis]|uniref:Uncharacterized protein n=1 Tax=Ixodes scapularis TaxID=6945 RepID=B7QEA6_IXOSC|nr:hypothetical protein IscW_ISCW012898 [Ixodes scapularis]|eukprot:XP_002413870.1 hypothetical protein IscW_ISCW012898 [Ixodes scapularis]